MQLRSAEMSDLRLVMSWVPDRGAWVAWAGPEIPFLTSVTSLWAAIGASPANAFVLVARDIGPLAFGQVAPTEGDYARIARLIVEPGHRRRGLGKRLLEALLEIASERLGAKVVDLQVYPSNLAAIRLYRAFGFRESESTDPALVRMELPLHEIEVAARDLHSTIEAERAQ